MTNPINPEVVILNGALELPSRQRAAFLSRACAGDAALLRQVEDLLQAHEQAEDFLEAPLIGRLRRKSVLTISCAEKPGDKIGRYRLLQQIGEGGCGVVYMAEQEESVRRRVALKVIKLGMDTRQVIARFEAERQALALMDHPNIAKVLDAGATETGRPFFVMELVRGVKITEYCDENKLSTVERLKLYIQVCHAIEHAHQKGIIHRDIKPSNILVTVNDGAPVPKVIDFGIAKAAQGLLTDQTLFTAFEQFIGTPAYMSPEQAVMTSLDIDTRTDIYSLGVLLYELLTGKTPFDTKDLLRAGLDGMRSTILKKDPLKPSTCLSAMIDADRTAMAKCRHTESPKLIQLVRGDLDWIVMKALEKERARRYETASGLAADVLRYLSQEPILARPPQPLYRFEKLVSRNKLIFSTAVVIIFAIVIALLGLTVSNLRIREARLSESIARQKSDEANRGLRETVSLLELQRSEDRFTAGDTAGAVAQLAAIIRKDPYNPIAASRLVSALLHRNWALPSAPRMKHDDFIESVAISPDGLRVLSAGRDKTVRIWDANSGVELSAMRHDDRVVFARYSGDGRSIVSASADGTARIWNAADGALLTPPLCHNARVNWAEFSPDGLSVLTASSDHTARLWDASSGLVKREIREEDVEMLVARFSPDGLQIATGTQSGSVRIWSAQTGELLFRLQHHTDRIYALAFSPDGRRLASASADKTARLWDPLSGLPVGGPLLHKDWQALDAVFSPDSRLLVTTSQEGTVRLWDAANGYFTGKEMFHEGAVTFAEFSRDGRFIVTTSADNSAKIWSVSGEPLFCQPLRHEEQVSSAGFSMDGLRMITGSHDRTAQLWDIRPRRYKGIEMLFDKWITSAMFSRDGNYLVAASYDGTARVMDPHTGRVLMEPLRHPSEVDFVEFSPDSTRIVTATRDGSAHIWDVHTGRRIGIPMRHQKAVSTASFSLDGERVVTASVDGTACVWNARTGAALTPFLRHDGGEVLMARFSPDGHLVVSAGEDNCARVWDSRTGALIGQPLRHQDHVKWVEFSPDSGKALTASTDNTACIWDLRANGLPVRLEHSRIVEQAVFSPDGLRVATASLDRTVQLWDAVTGRALIPPLLHESPVSCVAFSPDGQRLVTGCWNGMARLWDSNTGRPLTEWLGIGGRIRSVTFDPSGQHISVAAIGVNLLSFPPPPLPTPLWFAGFAEAIAGMKLGAHGNLETTPRADLETMIQEVHSQHTNGFYGRFAEWFLADPTQRATDPF